MHNGNWGFPKGHIENNETKEETAIREVFEETNVNIRIIPGFERLIKYIPNEKTFLCFSSIFPHKNLFITKIWDIFFKQGLKNLAFSAKVTPFIFDKGTHYA